jgi:predicted ABC-type transport system involved in lysophospholipase L1 biosynthesis ATPase subunit
MLIHGTSLVFRGKGILLRGPSGAGKSDLALRLMHHGGVLIADDQTDIYIKEGQLMARAPKALEGKLEVRGIGIVQVSFQESHVLCCLVDLMPAPSIERLPEPCFETLEGIALSRYALDPFQVSAVEKLTLLCL